MQNTLQEHMRFLERRIIALNRQIAQQPISDEGERNRLQAEILIAEQALAYYRMAYELEQKIS